MQLDDIKKLAEMARIDMSEEELKEIANDFDSILAYVGQVELVSVASSEKNYILENVTRDDVVTNPAGTYTDNILAEMPDTQDGFLKVKQIL
jgi:aspartyl-tRNA(Asn)/glutamyl-tRNA(Gln) amidotransferase subunit C